MQDIRDAVEKHLRDIDVERFQMSAEKSARVEVSLAAIQVLLDIKGAPAASVEDVLLQLGTGDIRIMGRDFIVVDFRASASPALSSRSTGNDIHLHLRDHG